jgi:hypothetical protein
MNLQSGVDHASRELVDLSCRLAPVLASLALLALLAFPLLQTH